MHTPRFLKQTNPLYLLPTHDTQLILLACAMYVGVGHLTLWSMLEVRIDLQVGHPRIPGDLGALSCTRSKLCLAGEVVLSCVQQTKVKCVRERGNKNWGHREQPLWTSNKLPLDTRCAHA